MDILTTLNNYLNEYNTDNNKTFSIDTIRCEFQKTYKLNKLKQLGEWTKLKVNENILTKLKKQRDDITSVYRLKGYDIYYYNSNIDKPQYRKATLVIFGMSQYHKTPPPKELISEILQIIKDVTEVDICIDNNTKPNYDKLKNYYKLTPYFDTRYINDTHILTVDKICIYNKQFKNKLNTSVYRLEATVNIPNIKELIIPLFDIDCIVKILW
jgi:hypothetical protein